MKCLVYKCPNEGNFSRGLCRPCYKAAQYQVYKGIVTWKELEDLGKVLRVGEQVRRKRRFVYLMDGMSEAGREARNLK